MVASKGFALNPSWAHYLASGTIAATFALGVLRFLLIDWSDSLSCNALLTDGQWLDQGFGNWQPQGCMMQTYKAGDAASCLAARRVLFIGDSVMRQLYFATSHMSDPSLPARPPSDNEKHANHTYTTKSGAEFQFIWDPFLNTSYTQTVLSHTSTSPSQKPTLLVLGSGLWYLRYAESGGISAWETMIDTTFEAISNGMPGIAEQVMFLPVEQVVPSKLSPERARSIRLSDVEAMNSDLYHRIMPPYSSFFSATPFLDPYMPSEPSVPISLPLAFNQMLSPSETEDGIHFSEKILKTQANILLNFQCNDLLPKKFPFDKTCCNSYPTPSILQTSVILLIVTWGPIAILGRSFLANRPRIAAFFPGEDYAPSVSIFGLAVGLTFFADRTGLWLKEQKQYDPWSFGILSLLALLAGLATMKKADKDLGFLNREQTDEWKGWMQIAILIYHYLRASQISGIYNPIRVLVAAYLFMTGYGHTTFYLKKADFGFLRIAQVMVRLNLLTIALAYVMDTDYLSYYFSPLVSQWFIIIYATMYAGSRFNDRTAFVILKILASMAIVTWLFSEPWILQGLFDILARFFNIHWSAKEWTFRVTLDLWIVYAGMLTAIAYIKIRELRLTDHPRWPLAQRASIILSAAAMLWFFFFELMQPSKFTYNAYHPYISIIPVLAFVVLRNANPILRSASSRLFCFIGTCSLETFILQFHIWLAGDSKGLLLVIPGTRWRPVNVVITTVIFVYLSHRVAEATGTMTTWVCGVQKKSLPTANPAPPSSSSSAPQPSASSHGGSRVGGGNREEEVPLTLLVDGQPSKEGSHLTADHQREPDTPIRPHGRWLDRLSQTPNPPSASNRLFSNPLGWMSDSGGKQGIPLGLKTAVVFGVLWGLNMAWPSPS
ncbi:hypothetical protein BOTBODRAFT_26553 [Botryobasidium botryosum FD-172 SS1]|uniref:Cas1p 10 TM acyl transferase domain-containing protein n=1 Tax=Botryobasidium botryosum (strain FD-172 SS1) TaxID=930990 RepID=A0A067MXP9_BOTB1|nr:hypothetical protein BOTBODRAFT_26553 [Botryobasidium botryosum FD-172 SS1]